MTRRDFYKRMFYRAAMARERIAGPTKYRDDIIGGNTLITGANRVLGYAIGMRMVADIFPEGDKKKEIMSKYNEIMDEIQDAQGKFPGVSLSWLKATVTMEQEFTMMQAILGLIWIG